MPMSVGFMPCTITRLDYIAKGCAKGEAKADFAHAPFNRVGENAVDADGCRG